MLVLIIPFFFKGRGKVIKKDEICTKTNIKYQAIFWAINLFYFMSVFLVALGGSGVVISMHNSLLVTKEAFEIIILSVKIINYSDKIKIKYNFKLNKYIKF